MTGETYTWGDVGRGLALGIAVMCVLLGVIVAVTPKSHATVAPVTRTDIVGPTVYTAPAPADPNAGQLDDPTMQAFANCALNAAQLLETGTRPTSLEDATSYAIVAAQGYGYSSDPDDPVTAACIQGFGQYLGAHGGVHG